MTRNQEKRRDNFMRLARMANVVPVDHFYVTDVFLEKFAEMVAAAEREKVAAWMRSKSYSTGHGDTVEDLLKELEWQVAEREREACARACDEYVGPGSIFSKVIRARGEQEQPR